MGWVGAGFRIGMQWHGLGDQLTHTLTIPFGALLTLLAAMLMAWYVGRNRGATLVEYGVYLDEVVFQVFSLQLVSLRTSCDAGWRKFGTSLSVGWNRWEDFFCSVISCDFYRRVMQP